MKKLTYVNVWMYDILTVYICTNIYVQKIIYIHKIMAKISNFLYLFIYQ